jgi:imidazolonepropionase
LPPGRVDIGMALALYRGRIIAYRPLEEIQRRYPKGELIDLEGRLVTPGLVDCHTHLIHGGNRASEFQDRLSGVSYEDIARAGGGIRSTMRATRGLTAKTLVEQALPRLDALIAGGVTTIEIKSGYGLNLETEQVTLRAARALADQRPVSISTTYLALHSVSPEIEDADMFTDRVCLEWLPAIAAEGLADAVDAFCETIAFTPAQVTRLFQAARTLDLPVKLHADQLSNQHGAKLAAAHGARSADHLEFTDADGAAAMARAGTVAVLLPGAWYFLGGGTKPPIDRFRAAGVKMAIATDYNPGSSPLTAPLLAMNMAATFFGMTVTECLEGMTRHAAEALGLGMETGTIEVGKRDDLAVWSVEKPAELVYYMGMPLLWARNWSGQWRQM